MGTRQELFYRDILIFLDAVVLIAAFVLSYFVRDAALGPWWGEMPPITTQAWLLGVILPTWLFFLRRFRVQESQTIGSYGRLAYRIASAQLMGGLVLFSVMYATRSLAVSRLFLVVFVVVSAVALGVERILLRIALASSRRLRGLDERRVVVVSDDPTRAERLARLLEAQPIQRCDVVGYLRLNGDPAETIGGKPVLGSVADGQSVLTEYGVDEVIAAVPQWGNRDLARLASACIERGVTFRTWIDLPEPYDARPFVEGLGERSYLVSFETAPLEPLAILMKRMLDIFGAVVGIVVAAAVRLWYRPKIQRESPGPVYFEQLRIGQNGRPFVLFKFRTMYPDAEHRLAELRERNEMKGAFFKMRDDPRLLPTGKALRRRHLDELPQFWNVLKGEMSLVGTRPPTIDEVAQYSPHHYRRLSMKPGITGLWQLEGNGKVANFEDVVRLDRAYIDNWSLWLDCKILWKTLVKVTKAEGW